MRERSVRTIGSVSADRRSQHFPGIVTRETEMMQRCSRARSSSPVASAVQTLRVSLINATANKTSGHPPLSPVLTVICNMPDDIRLLNKTLETWVIRVAMLQNPRQPVPVTDTENFQNDS